MNEIVFAGTPTGRGGSHIHEEWELLYCTGGEGRLAFSDVELICRSGDLIAIPPGMAHTPLKTGPHEGICLRIANATLTFRYPMVLHDDANCSLLHLMQDTIWLFHSDADYRAALLPAYGHLLAQHVSSRRASSPRNQMVEEIAQNIVQNYANPNYELDALLKSAPYCYDYLCRLFRQELHTTPNKYLMDLRLQSAADLLRGGTGRSITEIARMCGYNDPLYFSRMFKKRYGVSPREYGKTCE